MMCIFKSLYWSIRTNNAFGRMSLVLLVCLSMLNCETAAVEALTTIKAFGSHPDGTGEYADPALILGNDGALYGTTNYGGIAGEGILFKINPDGTAYTTLHSFGTSSNDGRVPYASTYQGLDNALYGTTSAGGEYGRGTVYKIQPDGTGYSVLHSFNTSGGDGQSPNAGLIQGADSTLYGTTYVGGNGYGTVFKIRPDGSGYATLHTFGSGDPASSFPTHLMTITGGLLYGVTSRSIFSLSTDGTLFQTLLTFQGSNGNNPSGIMLGNDGRLYGQTYSGGNANNGVIFGLNLDGTDFSILHHFQNGTSDGQQPIDSMLQLADGRLCGVTQRGGLNSKGTVFAIKLDGSGYTIIHDFQSQQGLFHDSRVAQTADGTLYGVSSFDGGEGLIFRLQPDGSGFGVVYSFYHDGTYPLVPPLQVSDGTFYGTTSQGGASGAGVVYKIESDGSNYNILHSFGSVANDGSSPRGGLIEGDDGYLYGTTYSGGAGACGTIFKLHRDGSGYQIIRSFLNFGGDARNPNSTLLLGSDGDLYGTAVNGGDSGRGAIFKIDSAGTNFSILYSFAGSPNDGQNPMGSLVKDGNGTFYGTTVNGGSSNRGTVFKLREDGSDYGIVYSFGVNDGLIPECTLTIGSNGALYGITRGAPFGPYGTIFRVNTDGAGFSTLHSFPSFGGDGLNPDGGLVLGSSGALFGAARQGGSGNGIVFCINQDGSNYRIMHKFSNVNGEGSSPRGNLTKNSDGSLSGVTERGGTSFSFGTVYTIVLGSITSISGDNQTATVGTPFSAALTATVRDAAFRPVAGIPVTFLPPNAGPGGSFATNSTVLTDGNGVATAPLFTANSVAGAFSVSAQVAGGNIQFARYNLQNLPGALSVVNSTIAVSPASIPADGVAFSSIIIQLKDSFGNDIVGGSDVVEINATLGSLNGVVSIGLGRYTDQLRGSAAGTASISAKVNGATLAQQANILLQPGPLHHFEITDADGTAFSLQTYGVPFVAHIVAQDITNNTVTSFNGTVDLLSSGTLQGSPIQTAAFKAGVLEVQPITILSVQGATVLSATRHGGTESGVSNSFAVQKATATVILANLIQTYDGSLKAAGITTLPIGLNSVVTYNGSSTLPANAGNYTVTATIVDPNYQGSATDVLTIGKASQSINFAALNDRTLGDAPYVVSATGGASVNPVTFSVVEGAATATGANGNTITLTGVGLVTIRAAQDGNGNYDPAAHVDRSFSALPPAPNNSPTTSSGILVAPLPLRVGDKATFTVAASDADNDTLVYNWDFGDSTNGTGMSASHTYSGSGTFLASVTVTDGKGGSTVASIAFTVGAPFGGGPQVSWDSDGDGFSDEIEIAAGSSPGNAAETPTGSLAAEPLPLIDARLAIKLNFIKPGNDSIKLSGTLLLRHGVDVDGMTFIADIGGVAKAFTLNSKGTAKTKDALVKVFNKGTSARTAKFALKLIKGNFSTALANEGLVGNINVTTKNVTIPVMIIAGKAIFENTQIQTYNAIKGKSGSTKDIR